MMMEHATIGKCIKTRDTCTDDTRSPDNTILTCCYNHDNTSTGTTSPSTSTSTITTQTTTSTATATATQHSHQCHQEQRQQQQQRHRFHSLCYMTLANALHFGAYELARSAISALFTTTTTTTTTTNTTDTSSLSTASTTISSTIPFALGMVSPCSILLLYCYRKILFDRIGPQLSLRYTTIFYTACLSISALIIQYCNYYYYYYNNNSSSNLSKYTIILIFIVKNSFVNLLYSQHWSFITSVLMSSSSSSSASSSIVLVSTSDNSQQGTSNSTTTATDCKNKSKWRNKLFFSDICYPFDTSKTDYTTIIAGIASIVATLFSWLVGPILYYIDTFTVSTTRYFTASSATETTITTAQQQQHQHHQQQSATIKNTNNNDKNIIGLTGLLLCSSFVMMLTTYYADMAYQIAHKNGFAPIGRNPTSQEQQQQQMPSKSLYHRTKILFHRVPVLHILCYEVLLCQGVSSLMSYLFLTYIKLGIPNDIHRATYSGTIYGRINGCSGILQFLLLPFILRSHHHPQPLEHEKLDERLQKTTGADLYWLALPTILGISGIIMMNTSFQDKDQLLNIITIAFCTMKVLEYSLRVALIGRIYGPLDDESRFLGKEVVSMIANRFGKSCSAVLLALLSMSTTFPFLHYAPYILVTLCTLWFCTSIRLIQLSHSTMSTSPDNTKKKID